MSTISVDFAHYCCELLAPSLGPCVHKRMFGGFGVSADKLTVAWIADLGNGPTLWLKANDESRTLFEQAGCARFSYSAKGQQRSANYYAAPAAAMESPAEMAPWARLAMQAALLAANAKPATQARKAATGRISRTIPARSKPAAKRAAAPAAKPKADRKASKS